jgi:hypothetical protein
MVGYFNNVWHDVICALFETLEEVGLWYWPRRMAFRVGKKLDWWTKNLSSFQTNVYVMAARMVHCKRASIWMAGAKAHYYCNDSWLEGY